MDVLQPSAENIKGDSPEFQRKSLFRKLQDTVQESSKTILLKMTGDVEEERRSTELDTEATIVAEESNTFENA